MQNSKNNSNDCPYRGIRKDFNGGHRFVNHGIKQPLRYLYTFVFLFVPKYLSQKIQFFRPMMKIISPMASLRGLKACIHKRVGVVLEPMKCLLALVVSLILAGCATDHPAKTLTLLDSGHQIMVTVGQVLVIELPSNRSTGYCWNYRREAEPVVEKVGEPAYEEDSNPLGLVGAGGTEIWRFRATKVGWQPLRLEYARPWEKEGAAARQVSFDVVVGER